MRVWDPGWKKFGSGIRDGKNSDPGWEKIGSGIEKNSDPDPQHCLYFPAGAVQLPHGALHGHGGPHEEGGDGCLYAGL
jgi:hypothetical protein